MGWCRYNYTPAMACGLIFLMNNSRVNKLIMSFAGLL